MLISGEYEIVKNRIDYGERQMTVEFELVTAEDSDNSSEKFFEEFEKLLKKYAI